MSFGKLSPKSDRRQFGRRACGYNAWIRIQGRPSQACLVLNISSGGALLECDYPKTLPFWFELDIPAMNAKYPCEARHRTDTTIGVAFLQAEPLVEPGAQRAAPVRTQGGTWGSDSGQREVRRVDRLLDRIKPAS